MTPHVLADIGNQLTHPALGHSELVRNLTERNMLGETATDRRSAEPLALGNRPLNEGDELVDIAAFLGHKVNRDLGLRIAQVDRMNRAVIRHHRQRDRVGVRFPVAPAVLQAQPVGQTSIDNSADQRERELVNVVPLDEPRPCGEQRTCRLAGEVVGKVHLVPLAGDRVADAARVVELRCGRLSRIHARHDALTERRHGGPPET
jgi:hypothetical protein